MGKIRVLLAEEHVMGREGTPELIQREPGMEAVGEVGDGGKEATELANKLRPDVVTVDIAVHASVFGPVRRASYGTLVGITTGAKPSSSLPSQASKVGLQEGQVEPPPVERDWSAAAGEKLGDGGQHRRLAAQVGEDGPAEAEASPPKVPTPTRKT